MKKRIIFSFCALLILSIPLPIFAQLKTDPDPAGKHPYRYVAPIIIPDDLLNVYPQSIPYWTGTTDSITKTDGEVNTVYPNLGWMVFDVSGIPDGSIINSIVFNGYANSWNWPYWSITPMANVDPVNGTAGDIYNQVSNNWQQGIAYSYNNEPGIIIGWVQRSLEPNALTDLQNALAQDWFAMGFIDWDFNPTWYINFAGWNSNEVPYLEIDYAPLPVELTSFTANVNENNVRLKWSTATEINNSGFEVERKSFQDWEKIGFIPGFGTTTEVHSYSFIDANILSGTYNYRLKQVDFNGRYKYSNEIEVKVSIPNKYSLEQNYPNPFNPTTTISYSIKEKGFVTLKVFDILGNEVKTLVNEEQDAGSYKFDFNASALSSGIYFYTLNTGEFVLTKKMILLK